MANACSVSCNHVQAGTECDEFPVLFKADETHIRRKFYMAENEIGNENEYDNGDEFDKVNNTFPTGRGLFELSDTQGTMPSRVWRRILPVTISCVSSARCIFVGWSGLVVSLDLLHFCLFLPGSSVNIDRCIGSHVPRSHQIRLVTS